MPDHSNSSIGPAHDGTGFDGTAADTSSQRLMTVLDALSAMYSLQIQQLQRQSACRWSLPVDQNSPVDMIVQPRRAA